MTYQATIEEQNMMYETHIAYSYKKKYEDLEAMWLKRLQPGDRIVTEGGLFYVERDGDFIKVRPLKK